MLHNSYNKLQNSYILKQLDKKRPLSINAFSNEKTLDYLVDNQAFVGFIPLSIFAFFNKKKLPFAEKNQVNKLSISN